MAIKSMEDLFLHELQDLYDAEHQIVEALPMMAQNAGAKDLKAAFEDHLTMTKQQIKRLDQVFKIIGAEPERKTCDGMKGLIKEANHVIEEKLTGAIKDAAMIAAAQKVEHYEIAGYGTLRTFAYLMGFNEAAQLLQQTLDEEEQTDKNLTQIANKINVKAIG